MLLRVNFSSLTAFLDISVVINNKQQSRTVMTCNASSRPTVIWLSVSRGVYFCLYSVVARINLHRATWSPFSNHFSLFIMIYCPTIGPSTDHNYSKMQLWPADQTRKLALPTRKSLRLRKNTKLQMPTTIGYPGRTVIALNWNLFITPVFGSTVKSVPYNKLPRVIQGLAHRKYRHLVPGLYHVHVKSEFAILRSVLQPGYSVLFRRKVIKIVHLS